MYGSLRKKPSICPWAVSRVVFPILLFFCIIIAGGISARGMTWCLEFSLSASRGLTVRLCLRCYAETAVPIRHVCRGEAQGEHIGEPKQAETELGLVMCCWYQGDVRFFSNRTHLRCQDRVMRDGVKYVSCPTLTGVLPLKGTVHMRNTAFSGCEFLHD